ncbi:hypothetical protein BC831DRAFT_511796 [Entophlyctis helioformis]|nr:hypothetical protein BC831DRAFT_511796 [Entophlyctis helioformis]
MSCIQAANHAVSRPSSTSAGHIQPGVALDIQVCPVCHRPVQMVQLSGENVIPDDVDKAFTPMSLLLDEFARVARFQHTNALALITSLKRSNRFYRSKVVEFQQKYKQVHE